MIVKISINAIEHYLTLMMSVWFNHHDMESEFLGDYEEGVLEIERHMEKWNDKKYVQLAFAYLIESKHISPEIWGDVEDNCNYSFVEFEFKEIVEYAYSILWANTQPKEALKGYEIEFIKTGIDETEWYSIRDELNPDFK